MAARLFFWRTNYIQYRPYVEYKVYTVYNWSEQEMQNYSLTVGGVNFNVRMANLPKDGYYIYQYKILHTRVIDYF